MASNGIQVLDELKQRRNQRLLDIKPLRDDKHASYMTQLKNVTAQSVDEIAIDIGDARLGITQVGSDGTTYIKRLNRILLFSTQATPTILLPNGSVAAGNILEIWLTGEFVQNSGAGQTITPRFYIGKSGSETLVTSDTALTVAAGANKKAFEYRLRVTSGPAGGKKVKVEELFYLETSAGAFVNIMKTTTTTVIDIDNLNQINSCFFRIANGAAATVFKIYTNNVSFKILNTLRTGQIHWYSQPAGAEALDAFIVKEQPTTNYGSDVTLGFGEMNSGAFTYRTAIKFSELDNFLTDPNLKNFRVLEAYLYLCIAGNYATTPRTCGLYRLLVDFDPTAATWNIRKSATNWGVAGAQSGVDYNATPLANTAFSANAVGTTISFSLSATEVQNIITGVYPNYGFFLQMQSELNDGYTFHSGNAASPGLAPILYLIGEIPN